MFEYFLFMSVYAPRVCSALGSQERALDGLELDYPAPSWWLTKIYNSFSGDLTLSVAFRNTRHAWGCWELILGSSGKAAIELNHKAISPGPMIYFLKEIVFYFPEFLFLFQISSPGHFRGFNRCLGQANFGVFRNETESLAVQPS